MRTMTDRDAEDILVQQCSQCVGVKQVGEINHRLGSPVITGYAVRDRIIMKASVDAHGEARFSTVTYNTCSLLEVSK